MQISADLNKLEQHQDYLQQEQRTAVTLLNRLEAQYQMSAGISESQDELFRRNIQFVKDWKERTQRRAELLANVHQTLAEAKRTMSGNASDVKYMLRKET